MVRHSRLLLLIALTLASLTSLGCGRKESALNGNWKLDVDKQIAALKEQDMYKKLPEAARSKMEGEMKKGFDAMMFTFADGKLTLKSTDNKDAKGQEVDYKVTSKEGDKWQLETTDKNKKVDQVTITWSGNDNITLTPPKKGAMDIEFFLKREK